MKIKKGLVSVRLLKNDNLLQIVKYIMQNNQFITADNKNLITSDNKNFKIKEVN